MVTSIPSLQKLLQSAKESPNLKSRSRQKSRTVPKSKSRQKSRRQPTYEITPELSAVIKKKKATRQEAVKRVWDYIKQKKLHRGNEIEPDATLKKVTGTKKKNRHERTPRYNQ